MGHDLQFGIKVGLNEGAVDTAKGLTAHFLHMGLEAGDVEPVPGTPAVGGPARCSRRSRAPAPAALAAADRFAVPNYTVLSDPAEGANEWTYFLILPAGVDPESGTRENGFLPVPPDPGVTPTADFELRWERDPAATGVTVERSSPTAVSATRLTPGK